MKIRRIDLFSGPAMVATLALSFPNAAQACACCSEIGQRIEQTDSIERGELVQVRFAPGARLFADAGFPDSVEGLGDPSDQDYRLAVNGSLKELVFDFTDANGKTGRIVFLLPKRFTRFEVDPREAVPAAAGHGPVLYKEWRYQGLAKLSGVLAARGVWAHVRLILHGRGNSCTSAIDFDTWTLAVTGKAIRFKFLGATVR